MRRPVPFSIMVLFAAMVSSILIGPIPRSTKYENVLHPRRTPVPEAAAPPARAPRDDYEEARKSLEAGRLREAQDAYLKILLASPPDDPKAMQGFVTARRRMANNNPRTLRKQADAYLRAMISGAETGEHYTRESLRFLYIASLIGAAQIEAEWGVTTTARTGISPGRRVGGQAHAPSGGVSFSQGPAKNTTGSPVGNHRIAPMLTPSVRAPVEQTPSHMREIPKPRPARSPSAPIGVPPQAQPYPPAPAPARGPQPVAPSAPAKPAPPAVATILEAPSAERTAGTLRSVDCPRQAFGIDGSGSSQEFSVTPSTVIYAGTEKLSQICALKRFVGLPITVWGTKVGARLTARRVSVAEPAAPVVAGRTDGHEGILPTGATPPPPPAAVLAGWGMAAGPGRYAGQAGWGERSGIITTKIDNAALVVSREGVFPIVVTSGTKVVGSRTTFGAIARFDSVRALGPLTQSGTLVAAMIEVTHILDSQQLRHITTSVPGYVALNSLTHVNGLAGVGLAAGGASFEAGAPSGSTSASGSASVGGGGASVSGGASVNGGSATASGGASVSGGGASASGGASVSGGGASASGGASVNAGGASASGGASVSGGGASASGGASAKGGASVSGGASVNAGGVSANGGASLSAGGLNGGGAANGGASANSGGVDLAGGH